MSDQITGVLFDMDDTLIDWSHFDEDWRKLERQHLRHVCEFLESVDYAVDTSYDNLAQTFGMKAHDAWKDARSTLRAPHMGKILMETLAEFGVEANDTVTMDACLQAYQWQGVESVTLFEDVPPVLQQLIDEGYTIGILTNAFQPMWLRDAELERYDLLQYFPDEKRRMSAADIGYLKPHPKVFEYALEQMETPAAQTVYIGDNPVADVAGAQGAGMRAVLRVNKPTPPLISGLIVPDAAINSLEELPPLLDDWNAAAS